MSSEIWNPRSSASAEQPPDDLEDNSSFDGESTMAPLATHELSLSAQQPAVLQCLDREGWLVTPPVNGRRRGAVPVNGCRCCDPVLGHMRWHSAQLAGTFWGSSAERPACRTT